MKNPFQVFEDIRSAYCRYLDSPFRLRYAALLQERRTLLDRDRQLYRDPLFEPLSPYLSSGLGIGAAASQVGAGPDVAPFLRIGLLDNPNIKLESPASVLAALPPRPFRRGDVRNRLRQDRVLFNPDPRVSGGRVRRVGSVPAVDSESMVEPQPRAEITAACT